jgi:Histidine kinase-like ATPase domain
MAMTAHAALTVREANGTAIHAVPGVPYLEWLRPVVEVAVPACGGWGMGRHAARPNSSALSSPAAASLVATRTPQPAPGCVKKAREFTEATLRRWGVAGLAGDVGVVMSELLTNALRHGVPAAPESSHPPIRLGLLHPGSCVLCAVADPSTRVPVLKEPDYLAESGRGLHVVAALSQRWGWTAPGSAGKVVWATFALPA